MRLRHVLLVDDGGLVVRVDEYLEAALLESFLRLDNAEVN
jgi:hypothetical protein